MRSSVVRAVAGLAAIVVIAGVFVVSAVLFRGGFTKTVPVTVLSDRAGLVMNPDAKVKMRDVQVGTVAAIEQLPAGQAALHLDMDPTQLHLIPANVLVDIASTTALGAKFVQLRPPADPSPKTMFAGQTLDADHVTVEINTVFQQLTSVLGSVEPEKLNETLGAISSAFNGRGEKVGQLLSDFDALLAELEPSLPALRHDLQVAPTVINAYADAAPDLVKIADNTIRLSQTVVDEQQNLDAVLISIIGLADIGNQVVGDNRQSLTDTLHLLVPTTDLLNEYSPGLACGLSGALLHAKTAPPPLPGAVVSASFGLGIERYRYPSSLPKVAATGGPQCINLPLPYGAHAPFVVTDVGANPWKYGNQGILLNSDALKQALYGPLDGPPRNTAQVGQG